MVYGNWFNKLGYVYFLLFASSSIIVSDGSSNLRVFLFSLLLFASHKTNISSQLDRGIHIVYFGRLNGGDLVSLGLDGSEGMGYNTLHTTLCLATKFPFTYIITTTLSRTIS
jgi:hypothetical protein